MHKTMAVILTVFLLTGCIQRPVPHDTGITATTSVTSASTETTETTAVTTPPAATADVTEATTTTAAVTEPLHSNLFLSYVTTDEMVQYFNEVCLDAEIVIDGNASVLQRWEAPIYYQIYGEPTDKDLQVLGDLTQWINTVDGFPGISESEEAWQTNMAIYFCTQDELITRLGDQHYNVDGAFTFWYNDDIIYDCTICIRTDLEQEVRNSVILEEIYNSLGPAQDTDLRTESIIYSGYSIPQSLDPIDQVILKLLYQPSLACGMTASECDAAIRSLYY